MKTIFHSSCVLLAGATLLATLPTANARAYGVYTNGHGGGAYVGPRGAAVHGSGGRTAAVTRHGAAYAGPNGVAYTGRHTAGYVGAATLPRGYVATIPGGYRPVVYGGYHCYYSGGVYYRPVFYGGSTVYVVVP